MARSTTRRRKAAAKKRPSRAATARYREAVAESAAASLTLPSVMGETNGGGSPESVPGFDLFRAVTAGFETKRVAGATIVASQPDGGFFSQGGGSSDQIFVGSPAAKPENVIGADNRTRIADTAMTPWRSICHLEVEYDVGPVSMATGFLVGPVTVITAAHVLFDRRLYGWNKPRRAKRVRVLPGRNGTLAPYGYIVSDQFDLLPEWTAPDANETKAPAFDFGAIQLPSKEVEAATLGSRLGYFGLKSYTAAEEASVKLLFINNAGYPKEPDKPYGTLWYNAGRVSEWKDTYVEYMVDTEGGQSGSPIYLFDEMSKQRYVVAIHTTGDFINRGLRITPGVFETIRKWAKR
jgi:glutamyl endopeptidase